ncbi:MAG: 2-oxo acid dehydrogenase subunit E2 [Chthonomonadales bacterium]|nr:2-oxo acid dehydrogenase subunit E2 [Chthonomonadales bacterium]
MPTDVILPQLGESVAEGQITRWLKQPGDKVAQEEPLVEISTDKVNVELPAPAAGVVRELRAKEGDTVPVETVIAVIDTADADQAAPPDAAAPPEVAADGPITAEAPPRPPEPEAGNGARAVPSEERRHYTPLVRRMAREHGLDLDFLVSSGQLQGTGENGRVTKSDLVSYVSHVTGVLAAPSPAVPPPTVPAPAEAEPTPVARGRVPATPPTVTPSVGPAQESAAAGEPGRADEIVVPFTGMRRMIADHLSRSAFTAPHVTTIAQADVTRLVAFRAANKETWQKEYGLRLTYTPFFVKATADALLAFPMVNATIQGETIVARKYVHMGVAVSLGEGGLIVPVVRNAHLKDLVAVAREVEELAARARGGKLAPADVQGGTFTITNPGVFGAILSTPIINAPQSAILGVEAIQKMPVVREDDTIAIRSMMYLCLSYDHRVIDGETAIRFLQHLRHTLEDFRFFR